MASFNADWRDGFLFVGNQLCLDFVNTRPVINGETVELLSDWRALLRWFRAANWLHEDQAEGCARRWEKRPESVACLDQLKTIREHLRETVLRLEAGKEPGPAILAEVNRLLRAHPMYTEMFRTAEKLERRKRFEWQRPEDLLAPIAEAAAEMLVQLEPARLRKCESCVLHFYDTSKNSTRRWCSMQICGNRAKVAAYAQRKRSAVADS